ncbi:MAG: glutathione S-transferase family protein [Alphaproteobacteria bacterium]|nr:glutathione S-transferase family protein [Alphaproteobacteria bacterium]
MKLYSGPLSMFGAKVQIALAEKAIAFELEMVPFDMRRLYEPKHPDVVRVNPKRQVPVLIDGDLALFDSTQIFEYLEDRFPAPALWPRETAARARARQLELMADEVYFPPIVRLMGLQDRPTDPAAIAARETAAAFCAAMEVRLADVEFLAGPFTFADIAFFMAQVFGERMGAPMTAATPRLLAWRERMSRRPSVRRVLRPMLAFVAAAGRPAPPPIAAAIEAE